MKLKIRIWLLLLCAVGCALGAKPQETTITLARDALDPDTIGIGRKSTVTLTAAFSQPTTGVVIELLPSVLDETVLALGDILSVDKGAEIVASETNWNVHSLHAGKEYANMVILPEYTSMNSIVHNTRGVFTVGDISFASGQSTTETDYHITIIYEVVMVSMGTNVENTEFLVSSGMEYGDYIYIYQIGYILQAMASVAEDPSVVASDVSTIPVGETVTVDIAVTIPYPQSTLTVEAFDHDKTGDIFVTKMRVKPGGSETAFAYQINWNQIEKIAHECPMPTSMSFQLGPLTNKESQTDNPDPATYTIVIEVTFLARPTLAIVSKEYTIGLAVDINSDEIWVTSFPLTAVASNLSPFTTFYFTESEISPVPPAFVREVILSLVIPEKTEIEYTVNLSTEPVGGVTPAVSFLSIRPLYYGYNLPCDVSNPSIVFAASNTGGPKDTATYTFTLSNYRLMENLDESDNTLLLAVVFLIKPDNTVETNDTHKLIFSVNNGAAQEKIIYIDDPGDLPDSVDYSFELINSCPTNIFESRSSIMIDVIVTTEPDKIAGQMIVEAPIPTALDISNLLFCGARVKNVGKNVVCAQEGPVEATMSSWLDDGVNDHAIFIFDTMCNIQNVVDVKEDQFTIEIIVQVKDTEEILTNGVNDSFGMGIIYSNTELVTFKYDLDIRPPASLGGLQHVHSVKIANNDSTPADSMVLQWSPDGLKYHDAPFQYEAPTMESGSNVFGLTSKLVTQFVRLTDKTCTAGCRPQHGFETNPGLSILNVYGIPAKSDSIAANLMFAFDQNNETCMDLPKKSDLTTPPALWFIYTDTTITAAYEVTITGKSISCNSPGGPQITMAMFRSSPAIDGITGNAKKCQYISETGDDSLKFCRYHCSCTSDDCHSLVLFMHHKELTPTGPYQLCEITITT